MGYIDRHTRMKLYEKKLSEKNVKEEVLVSKSSSSNAFKKGQIVSYKDNEYIVKYCGDGNCVIEKDNKQEFVPCEELKLVKDNKLDEDKEVKNIYQVTYSTDGINYHSNVLVKAKDENDAKEIVLKTVKVKPHQDSEILVRERDQDFADDYVNRGMRLIESLEPDTLGENAVKTLQQYLTVSEQLSEHKESPITLRDVNKLIENLNSLKESIEESGDFVTEREVEIPEEEEQTPEVPQTTETVDLSSLLNSLITDELEAIDGYNGAVQIVKSYDNLDCKEDLINIFTDIASEENIHVGQLQKALSLVNPQAELMKSGEKEAEEQIVSTTEEKEEITEDVESAKKNLRDKYKDPKYKEIIDAFIQLLSNVDPDNAEKVKQALVDVQEN